MSSPFVMAISNRKGGAAKTTTAVSLTWSFAMRGEKVLLIDLDTQGHAGLAFNFQSKPDIPSIHDIFKYASTDLSKSIVKIRENIDFIPSNPNFEGQSVYADDLTRLSKRLSPLMSRYSVIILDTPPSLNISLLNAISIANAMIVPMIPHTLSAVGVQQLSRLSLRISSINKNLKMFCIVPVMVNNFYNLHRQVIDDMIIQFGASRVLSPIRVDIKLAEAFGSRKTIFEYDPNSRGTQDYTHLCDEIWRIWLSKSSQPVWDYGKSS